MKVIGIICEYNPFHNGHIYHLEKVKELFPDSLVILVISGNFTQRGIPSIINKWDKTEISLKYGIDLIVELPFVFATQASDIFAHGAISILKELKCDYLVFGSESNNIDNLKELANISLNNKEYQQIIKDYLDSGLNYPTSLSKALKDFTNIKIDNPNDLLGLSYIKEILKQKANIEPITIKRTNNYHDKNIENSISSATSIRNAINSNLDISKVVPKITIDKLNNNIFSQDKYFSFLKYKILTSNDLSIYQTVDEGIENRIIKYINDTKNYDELINKIKTKRYTYNKISRMLTHILCSFTKQDAKNMKDIEYIRILGFNKKGQKYLNSIKKETKVPIITNFKNIKSKMLDLEFKATCVYASILNEDDKNILIKQEYQNKPKMKD